MQPCNDVTYATYLTPKHLRISRFTLPLGIWSPLEFDVTPTRRFPSVFIRVHPWLLPPLLFGDSALCILNSAFVVLRVLRILFHFCYGSPPSKSTMFTALVTRVTGVTGFRKGVWVSLPVLLARPPQLLSGGGCSSIPRLSELFRLIQTWICAIRVH